MCFLSMCSMFPARPVRRVCGSIKKLIHIESQLNFNKFFKYSFYLKNKISLYLGKYHSLSSTSNSSLST